MKVRARVLFAAGWMAVAAVRVQGQPVTSAGSAASPAESSKAAALPVFDVVSVKPNDSSATADSLRFTSNGVAIRNASLLMIIRASHGMFNSLDDKFPGTPGWAKTKRFDIEAKVSGADAATFNKLNFEQRQLMVQAMLADRFQLRTHNEMMVQPVYLLTVGKGGPKLEEAKPATDADPGGTIKRSRGQISGENVVVSQLVSALTQMLGRTVVNEIGLKGKYDFTLKWTPDDAAAERTPGEDAAQESAQDSGPSIFTAIQEQLGLKLEAAKRPVECLVIDHVEMPSEN